MRIGLIIEDDLVQLITFVVCVAGVFIWLRWGRGRWGYTVAPITYLLHCVVFLVTITLDHSLSDEAIIMWSSAITLQAVITVTSAAALMLILRRRNGKRR